VTHARLRARQGDLRSARRILRTILAADPAHAGARRLLDEIGGRPDAPADEPREESVEAPRAATASELRGRFREALAAPERTAARRTIARLTALLGRISDPRA
jgi:hypothetical protein